MYVKSFRQISLEKTNNNVKKPKKKTFGQYPVILLTYFEHDAIVQKQCFFFYYYKAIKFISEICYLCEENKDYDGGYFFFHLEPTPH